MVRVSQKSKIDMNAGLTIDYQLIPHGLNFILNQSDEKIRNLENLGLEILLFLFIFSREVHFQINSCGFH